jgi:hypothetical protein
MGLASRLIEFACTEPGVESFQQGGPEWAYQVDGKLRTTKPVLTLRLTGARKAYWSVLNRGSSEPAWVAIQRHHALRDQADFWLLTHDYLEENRVERLNRTDAYHMLVDAKNWSSAGLEPIVLAALGGGQHRSVEELRERAGVHLHHVYATVLRLWQRNMVTLPMTLELMSPAWRVSGRHHD